jgi:hypothetical protein
MSIFYTRGHPFSPISSQQKARGMKRVRLKDAGIDICVTIDVKTVFMEKAAGDIQEELERADITRILNSIAAKHEGPVAKEVATEYKSRIS